MKKVLQPGGSSEESNAYIGPARQITIDVDRNEIRVHDGITPGGNRIATLDYLLTIFRASADDPLGEGLPDEGVGIIVRIGEGAYTVRSIAVDTDSFVVANASGEGGNPGISFKTQADGTWLGNVSGEVAKPIPLTAAQMRTLIGLVDIVAFATALAGTEATRSNWSALRVNQAGRAAAQAERARILYLVKDVSGGGTGAVAPNGVWGTRDIATVITNAIPGATVDTGTDIINLPIGSYRATIHASFATSADDPRGVNIRLRNSDDAATLILGHGQVLRDEDGRDVMAEGFFILAAAKNLKIEHIATGSLVNESYAAISGGDGTRVLTVIIEQLAYTQVDPE